MPFDWQWVSGVAAAFSGATFAQILSHVLTLRRDTTLREGAASRYAEHIILDYVLALSALERIFRSADLADDRDEFYLKMPGPAVYKATYGNLLDRLDFDVDVSPQFMFNARKWFAIFNQEIERFSMPECVEGCRVKLNYIGQTFALYLLAISEIVAWGKRERSLRFPFYRRGKWFTVVIPPYSEVVSAYHKLGHPAPDEKLYELVVRLDKRHRRELGLPLASRAATGE